MLELRLCLHQKIVLNKVQISIELAVSKIFDLSCMYGKKIVIFHRYTIQCIFLRKEKQ